MGQRILLFLVQSGKKKKKVEYSSLRESDNLGIFVRPDIEISVSYPSFS